MTNYPNSIDNGTTLPPASGDDATSVNASISAIEAIETELGIVPAGAYATVRTRLDILEARINNPFAPAPNVLNPFFIGNSGVSIQTSVGDPNILHVLAVPGSLYLREDGYQNVYVFRPDGYWHDVDASATLTVATRTISSSYAVDSLSSDCVILCNATIPITVTLPATPTVGRQLIIKDISGNARTNFITVVPTGGKIDGSTSFVLQVNMASLTIVVGNDLNWYIL